MSKSDRDFSTVLSCRPECLLPDRHVKRNPSSLSCQAERSGVETSFVLLATLAAAPKMIEMRMPVVAYCSLNYVLVLEDDRVSLIMGVIMCWD